MLEPDEQRKILGSVQTETEVVITDEEIEQGQTVIGEFEERARLAFRKTNFRSEMLEEETTSIVLSESISQDPIVQSVL